MLATKTMTVWEREGSSLRIKSKKQECIHFPCQKGVGTSGPTPEEHGTQFERLGHHPGVFIIPPGFFCGWKANQEGGRTGETKS